MERCEIVGGAASVGLGTKDINFFSEDNLPTSKGRNTASQIYMLFEFLKDPTKAAVFNEEGG
ncbi:hypothetical protein [Virgibacillus oceani]|uniref:Uncharacterized protein n=1 Tax=Virgibacillus oceani TaxID=1479511 RepID=A0A917HMQ1_9BACI|nr:hypothetical protein [Virgibacillus oceani]GGG83801.1 hypothetical protein GCM10011398_31690 [Virgibacillus oceani]